jgi:hypothetical protein
MFERSMVTGDVVVVVLVSKTRGMPKNITTTKAINAPKTFILTS